MENYQPKISTPVAFVLMAFAIIADLINWIPGVNIIVTVLTLGYQLYFRMVGVTGVIGLVGNSTEFIPGLSVIPALTAAIGLTIYVDWHPESALAKKINQAASKLKSKKAGAVAPVGAKIKTPKGALGELAAIE